MARLRPILMFVASAAAILLLLVVVLPWLAQQGYAGEVVQRNYEKRVDASPLFYTDSQRTMELLHERAERCTR